MKTIPILLCTLLAAAFLTSCETTGGGGDDTGSFAEPNRARTSQQVLEMHNQIHRQNF